MAITICLVALGITSVDAGRSDPASVDSLLAAAADTLLDRDRREALMKRALRYDRSGKTMHALARFYMAGGTPVSRQTAGHWLLRAVMRERENPDYQATHAELLWRTLQRPDSYRKALQVLELDPDHLEGLFWAGRFAVWAWEWTYFTDRLDDDTEAAIGMYSIRGGKTLTFVEYPDLGIETGIGYLTRAISLDPVHWPSHQYLGLAYYAAEMPEPLIELFEAYRQRRPGNWNAHFFAGLGYQLKGDLERAYRAYVDGLNRMTESARRFMQSVFLVRNPAETEGEPPPSDEEIRNFWLGKDPIYLTSVNERLLEQCRRVAYANLRFSDPTLGREGWQTDMGQVYIRYGDPRVRYMDGPGRGRKDVWDYGPFTAIFVPTVTWDSWRFVTARRGNKRLKLEQLVKAVPDLYQHPLQYDAPCQTAQFRHDNGNTRIEVYYALPQENVRHTVSGDDGNAGVDARQALFLFDTDWDTVRHSVSNVERMPRVVYESTDERFLLAGERVIIDPGTYFLAAEVEDRGTKRVGTFRERLRVRSFGPDTLEISDLLMARRIRMRENAPYGREQFALLPNPLQVCRTKGQAWFYFEIYNLSRDDFGATHYRISYQMQSLPEGMGDAYPADWTTAVSYTYRGARNWEPRDLRVDMDGASPGPRAFRVVVEDLHTGRRAMAETRFRVRW
ncbi:MAG: GWxTD domain-containing protein [Gemmatimonadota bacterium]|nr:GWxTD domain-containing protein [Gemmatimonadota bacterium]